MSRGRGTGLVALAAVLLLGLVPTMGRAEEQAPVHGIRVVRDVVLPGDGRLHELTLHSDALRQDTKIRMLLPAGYDDPAEAATRYPMLLLLHGANDSEASWTRSSSIEEYTATYGLIVVMPYGGTNGFYTDWVDGPRWETYHLGELVPWVDATYRTVGGRAGRAIAGLSMGGFGSSSYASRHPDRFVAMAEFSGGVDLADAGVAEAEALKALGLVGDKTFGPYLTHEASWRGHNPPDLATNLRGMSLRLTHGTGVPCAGDHGVDYTEAGVAAMHLGFTLALQRAGIPYEHTPRTCGTHEWHYWDADLGTWLPKLMALFADPPAAPAAFDFRFTEPQRDAWGWTFSAHRPAIEFVDLTGVSSGGLTARGSGLLDVVTAPAYEPGATYAISSTSAGLVTVPVAFVGPPLAQGSPTAATTATAVADGEGRLHFTLDLGPAHTANQYSAEGIAAELRGIGSYFRTATVAIARAIPSTG